MGTKKRVLITGTSAGFGRDTATALAERGHTVFATMRGTAGKNARVAGDLADWAERERYDLRILDLDVTRDESVAAALAAATGDQGIDVLINNAGIGTWGIDEGFTVSQAQRVFDVNLFGVMRMNRAVVPHFRRSGRGLIVYISSGLGRIVLPFMAVYTASKFAIEGYAECTSYELAPLGIESVIVEPGAYGTTFLQNCLQPERDVTGEYGATAGMFEAFAAGFEERAAAGDLGDPWEVVEALVEEVERPAGERPLRRTVGRDVAEPVSAINERCSQMQDGLLRAFGLRS